MDPRSPKITHSNRAKVAAWYPYYPGYSEAFVDDVLKRHRTSGPCVVLDPWNGSGTTTLCARKLGHVALGFDINPALVLVSKGRLLDRGVIPSVRCLTTEILDQSRGLRFEHERPTPEPLSLWFEPETASRLLKKSFVRL